MITLKHDQFSNSLNNILDYEYESQEPGTYGYLVALLISQIRYLKDFSEESSIGSAAPFLYAIESQIKTLQPELYERHYIDEIISAMSFQENLINQIQNECIAILYKTIRSSPGIRASQLKLHHYRKSGQDFLLFGGYTDRNPDQMLKTIADIINIICSVRSLIFVNLSQTK
jgi:hypothetical protein